MYGRRDTDFNDVCFQLKGLNDMLNDKLYSVGDIYIEEYQSRLEIGEELIDLLHSSDIVELNFNTQYNKKSKGIFIVIKQEDTIFFVNSSYTFYYDKDEKKWSSYTIGSTQNIISIMPYEKYKNNSYKVEEKK